MVLAIMQPYIFPYIGYFQLIQSVDKFIFYDDVDYIKGGWINRNKIANQQKELLFTIPLDKSSSFKKINEINTHPVLYEKWANKFLKTIQQSYSKAPYFSQAYPIIEEVFSEKKASIAEVTKKSIVVTSKYLQLHTEFVNSSETYKNSHLSSQGRVLDICKLENAKTYVNAIGGFDLYDTQDFLKCGIELKFLKPTVTPYFQNKLDQFIPGLSIIDLLMNLEVGKIQNLMKQGTYIVK